MLLPQEGTDQGLKLNQSLRKLSQLKNTQKVLHNIRKQIHRASPTIANVGH